MKKELIDKLFNEFDKDKELIMKNLIEVLGVVYLEAKDKYGKVTMTIKYEKNGDGK